MLCTRCCSAAYTNRGSSVSPCTRHPKLQTQGVLAGVLMAQHPLASSRQRRNRMWMAWGAMAVAILTKGLIGIVMPRLVLIVYTRIAHDWALWRRLHLLSGSLLVFVIAAPWFVLVSIRGPATSSSFRTWQRHTSTVQHRAAPWWYFVPQLVAGFLPWLVLSWRIARHRRRPLQRVSPSAAAGRLGGR